MSFIAHELTHFILSLLIGFIIWKRYHTRLGVFIAALLGGFLIDVDHFLDYFLAFGTKFNLTYFVKGYSFLKTDKIYIPFHSWELAIILTLASLLLVNHKVLPTFKRFNVLTAQAILLAFSVSLFLHLCIDSTINNMKIQSYFLYYRLENNFELKTMVTSDHYKKHLNNKQKIMF